MPRHKTRLRLMNPILDLGVLTFRGFMHVAMPPPPTVGHLAKAIRAHPTPAPPAPAAFTYCTLSLCGGSNESVASIILGQDSTFFRGTLEKMQSEGLQNCPRAAERSSRPEGSFGGPRTASFPEVPRKRVESLHYPPVLPVSYPITNHGILGALFSKMPPVCKTLTH